MRKKFVLVLIFSAGAFLACRRSLDMPTEFPTPPSPAASTPGAKITYKTDVELEKQFAEIAKDAKGRVGVAAVAIETGDAAFLNADQHFPMQSVYKLPIAMAVMEKARLGQVDLDEKVAVAKEDFVRPGQRSPLRDLNANGGEFTIRDLVRLSIVESDGTASDVLLRVLGGPSEVQSYLSQIGIADIKVVNTEKEIDWKTQYDNWATPRACLELLTSLNAQAGGWNPQNLEEHQSESQELLHYMFTSSPGTKRLKGLLPLTEPLTGVAHKTGTGGSRDGVAAATNDIGIIYLPNEKHLAIAVFVSDSTASGPARETVIAKIAKAAWDKWQK